MSAVWTPLIAIYNQDPSLLDGLHVPTAAELPADIEYIDPIPELSDADLRNELLFELGELQPVYSDPKVLKQMVELWSRISHSNFVLLWQTALYKYNPIWNKDGTYTETRELTGNELAVGSNAVNTTVSTDTTTSGSESTTTDETVTHDVTGYDTNSMSPAYDDVTDGEGSRTTSGTTNEESALLSQGNSRMNTDNTEEETITRKEQGNIGVTTTQAMIKEQREIVTFNIYTYIIEAFKKRFMLQVY